MGLGELESLGRLPPAQLNDLRLATYRVGAAMQQIGGGDAAGQGAIDGNIIRVKHIGYLYF